MKSKKNSNPLLHPRQLFVEWYQSSRSGRLLQKSQTSYLLDTLQLNYNQKILQVGMLGSEYAYIREEFRSNFVLLDHSITLDACRLSTISAAPEALPIANESIDILILPHVLEFLCNPQQLLSEAERILAPEGQLLILAFNPWSLRGMTSCFSLGYHSFPQRGIGCYKLIDWLKLLKFEPQFSAGFGNFESRNLIKPDTLFSRSLAYLADAYALKAIKRTFTLIPIRTHWITKPQLIPGEIADTSFSQKIK